MGEKVEQEKDRLLERVRHVPPARLDAGCESLAEASEGCAAVVAPVHSLNLACGGRSTSRNATELLKALPAVLPPHRSLWSLQRRCASS